MIKKKIRGFLAGLLISALLFSDVAPCYVYAGDMDPDSGTVCDPVSDEYENENNENTGNDDVIVPEEDDDGIKWQIPGENWPESYDHDIEDNAVLLHGSKGNLSGNIVIPAYAEIDGKKYSVVLDPAVSVKKTDNAGESEEKVSLWYADRRNLNAIKFEKGVSLKENEENDVSALFKGLENVKTIDVTGLDISAVKSLSSMFEGCTSLSNLRLKGMDTSSVKNMSAIFKNCKNLQAFCIDGLDTSNVSVFDRMFYGCFTEKYVSGLDISFFKTEKAISFRQMFEGCELLTWVELPQGISGKDFSRMFYGCKNINVNWDSFDTSKAEDMSEMFMGCEWTCPDLRSFVFPKGCVVTDIVKDTYMSIYLPAEWIKGYDFSANSRLEGIYYEGNEEQWNALGNIVPEGVEICFDYKEKSEEEKEDIPAVRPVFEANEETGDYSIEVPDDLGSSYICIADEKGMRYTKYLPAGTYNGNVFTDMELNCAFHEAGKYSLCTDPVAEGDKVYYINYERPSEKLDIPEVVITSAGADEEDEEYWKVDLKWNKVEGAVAYCELCLDDDKDNITGIDPDQDDSCSIITDSSDLIESDIYRENDGTLYTIKVCALSSDPRVTAHSDHAVIDTRAGGDLQYEEAVPKHIYFDRKTGEVTFDIEEVLDNISYAVTFFYNGAHYDAGYPLDELGISREGTKCRFNIYKDVNYNIYGSDGWKDILIIHTFDDTGKTDKYFSKNINTKYYTINWETAAERLPKPADLSWDEKVLNRVNVKPAEGAGQYVFEFYEDGCSIDSVYTEFPTAELKKDIDIVNKEYTFRVRIYSNDISKYYHSLWSDLSEPLTDDVTAVEFTAQELTLSENECITPEVILYPLPNTNSYSFIVSDNRVEADGQDIRGISAGTDHITVISGDKKSAPIPVYVKYPVPSASYSNGKIRGLAANAEYLINDKIYVSDENGELPVDESWTEDHVSVVRVFKGEDKCNSSEQILKLEESDLKRVSGVTVSPNFIQLSVGESVSLNAAVYPEDASDKSVSWNSSDAAVVEVDENGRAVAVASGNAVITVITVDGNHKDTCEVTVVEKAVPVSINKITLDKEELKFKTGDAPVQLKAEIEPEEAEGVKLIWTSTDVSVAAVSDNGLVTPVGEGSALISVSDEAGLVSAGCKVTVRPKQSAMNPVIEIEDKEEAELHMVRGQKFSLPDDNWSVTKNKYVTISKKGVITAKNVTSSAVKLTNGKKTISVFVTQPKMTKKSVTYEVGEKHKTDFIYDDKNLVVQWYSSAPDVAAVDDGMIETKGKGTAVITAYINGKAYTCKVKVKETVVAAERDLHLTLKVPKTISLKGVKKPKWVADAPELVRINGNKFTALKSGETTLTAQSGDKVYKIHLYAEDPTISTRGITPAGKNKYKVTLKPGETLPIEFNYVDQEVIFKSSKGEYAYYDDGEIVAQKKGKTKLSAKINGKTITITVTVE
ncbi:MAG: Ig-like domain-containing protein [Lachnospiraceae bacterium]|nr:Ig-like domain-containing protein [Lachnospiraceae bacterium]